MKIRGRAKVGRTRGGGDGSGGPGGERGETGASGRNRAVLAPISNVPRNASYSVTPQQPAPVSKKTIAQQISFGIPWPERSKSAVDAACEMKRSNRKFGEIPSDDWTPPAPWQTADAQETEREWAVRDEYEKCAPMAPVEERHPQAVSVGEPERIERIEKVEDKPAPIEQLANWWENAKTSIKMPEIPSRKKRRKLN